MLTVAEVAKHYSLKPDTIRRKIRKGAIDAIGFGGSYRLNWPDVWACEHGPTPKGPRISRYQDDLLSKTEIANELIVCVRTVERWIAEGLPTRNVFGRVRCNPHDVTDWMKLRGINLPADWWK